MERIKEWNTQAKKEVDEASSRRLRGRQGDNTAFRDVSVFFPEIIDLLPFVNRGAGWGGRGGVSWGDRGGEGDKTEEEGGEECEGGESDLTSPWLVKLREKHKAKVEEAVKNKAKEAVLYSSSLPTPIDPKNSSRHNLTISTGFDGTDSPATRAGYGETSKVEALEGGQVARPSMVPLKPTLTFCGTVESEALVGEVQRRAKPQDERSVFGVVSNTFNRPRIVAKALCRGHVHNLGGRLR